MDYHKTCRKILGQTNYENLVIKVAKDIIKRFSINISLEEFIKIIEINIRTILIIGISKGIKLDSDKIKEKIDLENTRKYLSEEEYLLFVSMYNKYINIIEKYIKQ